MPFEDLKKHQKIKKTISLEKFIFDEIEKIQKENNVTFSKVINFLLNEYMKNIQKETNKEE